MWVVKLNVFKIISFLSVLLDGWGEKKFLIVNFNIFYLILVFVKNLG